ncbi:MAG: GNAT family N-acetyltransferase [Candidatus Eremiobacteraeota bacterium]|nr:GNAT family N-acetyltransferase [Candidatus Eremiobacteraeota bacterium]
MIRTASSSDAARIAELTRQLGYDVSAQEIAGRLRRRGERREVFVAVCADLVIGWAAVCVDAPFIEGFCACIEGLVVDETARSRGAGALLLSAAEAWARTRGCTAIRVGSNVVRERAHAFYHRRGYVTIKAQYQLRKTL